MKKFTGLVIGAVLMAAVVVSQAADPVEGTRIGNAVLGASAVNGIAIGGGNSGVDGDTGVALVTASGAAQIGNGSNTVANTIKYRDSFLVLAGAANTSGLKLSFYQVASGTAQQTLSGYSTMLGAFATYQGNSPSNSTVAAYFKGATNVTLTSSTGVTNAVNLLVVGY